MPEKHYEHMLCLLWHPCSRSRKWKLCWAFSVTQKLHYPKLSFLFPWAPNSHPDSRVRLILIFAIAQAVAHSLLHVFKADCCSVPVVSSGWQGWVLTWHWPSFHWTRGAYIALGLVTEMRSGCLYCTNHVCRLLACDKKWWTHLLLLKLLRRILELQACKILQNSLLVN